MVALSGLVLLLVALVVSPPESNAVWALDGFRSIALPMQVAVVAAAVAGAFAARTRRVSGALWIVASISLAALLAGPLRERIHMLGDTDFRIRSVSVIRSGMFGLTAGEWSRGLHAQPLDILVNLLVPIGAAQAGARVLWGVQAVSFVLCLVFVAGVWRVAALLSPRPDTRAPVTMLLAISGILLAFAGYAESAALLLATGAWWWATLLSPLRTRRDAIVLAATWLVVSLAHRQGLALVVPMALRATIAGSPADDAAARRLVLALLVPVVLVAVGVPWALQGESPFGQDRLDLWAILTAWTRGRRIPAGTDLLNLVLLVCPLVVLVPAIAKVGWPRHDAVVDARGERAATEAGAAPTLRSVSSALQPMTLAIATALALAPAFVIILTGPHELGAHRDWDVVSFWGWSLTVGIVAAAVRAWTFGRLTATATAAVPALVLLAGSWIGVNADTAASERRAARLAEQSHGLEDEAKSSLEAYLAQRAMNRRDAVAAVPHFERAYALAPNPRLLLLAAEARAASGDVAGARATLARARATGALNEHNRETADLIEQRLDAMAPAAAPDTSRREH